MHNKPQNVDFFSPSTLSCMSASPSAWQPIGTSCHVRPSVSWVTNMSHSLGRAWRTCPLASQTTVEPLEWTVGEVSGLWLNWFWILAKHIFHMFILLFFSSSHGVKKKKSKIFLRRGIVASFQEWPLCLSGSCCNECCPTFRAPSPFKYSKVFIHLPLSSRDCKAIDVAEPIEWQCC